MKPSTSTFVKCIMDKNYAAAKDALTSIMNEKLKQRISTTTQDLKENRK